MMAGIPITSLMQTLMYACTQFSPREIYLQIRNVGWPDTVRDYKRIKENNHADPIVAVRY